MIWARWVVIGIFGRDTLCFVKLFFEICVRFVDVGGLSTWFRFWTLVGDSRRGMPARFDQWGVPPLPYHSLLHSVNRCYTLRA